MGIKHLIKIFSVCALTTVIIISYQNCSRLSKSAQLSDGNSLGIRDTVFGTDTGNPFTDLPLTNPVDTPAVLPSDSLYRTSGKQATIAMTVVQRICQKYKKCDATIDWTQCVTTVREIQGLPYTLGIEPGAVENTMTKLSNLEKSKTPPKISFSGYTQCLKALKDLPCTDTILSANDFTMADLLMQSASLDICSTVYFK